MTDKNLPALKQISQGLEKFKPNLAKTLPRGLSVDVFMQKALNAITTHPQRDKLEQADRATLYTAIQKSAADGLQLDGREATLVCFFDKKKNCLTASYIPMVQGLVKLARNSGEIASISSEVVYDNDEFTLYHDLDGTKFKHEPNWRESRTNPILVWASVKTKDGEVIARALSKERIMQIAASGQNGFQYDPQKGQHFEEWWRKAAIKNVLKYAPKSTELERVIAEDNQVESPVEYEDVIDNPEVVPTPPKENKTKAQQVIEDDIIPDADVVYDESQEEDLPI